MRRTLLTAAVLAGALPLASSTAHAAPLYGVMFRTGGQTSGLYPKLYDINPATGAATNPRNVNVNDLVGIAVHPTSGEMYGLTDQFGRINNVSGQAGKNLIVKIDPLTGAATRVGQLDPTNTASDALLAAFEGDLAFNPITGTLWGVTTKVTAGVLFTVNTTTGLGTAVSTIFPADLAGLNYPGTVPTTVDLSALAFTSTGTLYVLDTTYPDAQQGPARLYQVDPATGNMEAYFPTSFNLGSCAGMTIDPLTGTLYITDGDTGGTNKLYRYDFALKDLVPIGNTGAAGGIYQGLAGLAFGPIPEPSSLALLPLAALPLSRRRR